jgi:hypothetical protein
MTFKPTYLYIKTHKVTGLKYFGKTTKSDPSKYHGSGEYWQKHLRKHGKDILTEIVGYYENKEECVSAAIEFSIVNNIVESNEWANFKIENGLDGGSDKGHKKTITERWLSAAREKSKKSIENETNPFMGEAGSKLAKERNAKLLAANNHNFQGDRGSIHSTELNKKRVENGTHNLLRRPDGSSHASDRVTNGTHNWQNNTNTVSVVDKAGNKIRVPGDIFWNQEGPKEEWEYVGITSKIAKKRLTLTKK